jgi:dolichyl-phosphate-mannose-protein mannosyltransferase
VSSLVPSNQRIATALATWLKRPAVALAVIAIVAAVPRFYHLGQPPDRVFDEVYYSKDACLYAGHTPKQCDLTSSGERYWVIQERATRGETSWVHPQLGKWAIAAGILGEGNDPFGWRVASAAAGTATVILTAYMAWLVFGSILWTYVAGLLLATETLSFVQSRVSMLDVFLAFWVMVGFTCLLLDRRWIEGKTPPRFTAAPPRPDLPPGAEVVSFGPGAMAVDEPLSAVRHTASVDVPSPIWRPWRFAAGFAFGAAMSTKWSGALALLAGGLLAAAWEITRRRRAGDPHAIWNAVRLELLGGVLAFLIVPIAVYLVSYTRYFVYQSWHPSVWWSMQYHAWHFHSHELSYIDPTTHKHRHPYESTPWLWLAMTRPVSYYFKSPGTEILAMGHPLLFWTSILVIPYVGWRAYQRRDWVAWFLVVAILIQYLPWFLAAGEVEFIFYALPMVPFLILAAVYTLRDLSDTEKVRTVAGTGPGSGREVTAYPYRSVAIGYVAVYVVMFLWFYPILTGWHLSYTLWRYHMWMRSWI